MSDSVQPHRWQPTRLRHPWDSPGKNTGVGCHFLLQCMKVESESEVAQSCPTLCDPVDCSLPGSSVHGIFQARVLEWGATAFSIKMDRGSFFPKEDIKIVKRHMKICSISLKSSQKCKSKPQWDNTLQTLQWVLSERQEITSVSKDVERKELLCIVGETAHSYSLHGKQEGYWKD